MNGYHSLYTWAMERQEELRAEAEERRLVRQARRRGSLPTDLQALPRLRVVSEPEAAEEPAAQKSA